MDEPSWMIFLLVSKPKISHILQKRQIYIVPFLDTVAAAGMQIVITNPIFVNPTFAYKRILHISGFCI